MLKQLLALLLAACAFAAQANEAVVRKTVEEKLGAKVTSVAKAGYLGLYEVVVDGRILYTDAKASAFIFGSLVDVKSMQNVTEARLKTINAIKFADLPFDRAIKQVRGNGKRVLATFEDPNCGYCKKLHRDIQKLENVTIYTFMVAMLNEDSLKKSKQIWCASDRAKAWNDWMIENKAPAGKDDCDAGALEKNMEFAARYRIDGTPTLIFADGERIPGAVPLANIELKFDRLNAAGK